MDLAAATLSVKPRALPRANSSARLTRSVSLRGTGLQQQAASSRFSMRNLGQFMHWGEDTSSTAESLPERKPVVDQGTAAAIADITTIAVAAARRARVGVVDLDELNAAAIPPVDTSAMRPTNGGYSRPSSSVAEVSSVSFSEPLHQAGQQHAPFGVLMLLHMPHEHVRDDVGMCAISSTTRQSLVAALPRAGSEAVSTRGSHGGGLGGRALSRKSSDASMRSSLGAFSPACVAVQELNSPHSDDDDREHAPPPVDAVVVPHSAGIVPQGSTFDEDNPMIEEGGPRTSGSGSSPALAAGAGVALRPGARGEQ